MLSMTAVEVKPNFVIKETAKGYRLVAEYDTEPSLEGKLKTPIKISIEDASNEFHERLLYFDSLEDFREFIEILQEFYSKVRDAYVLAKKIKKQAKEEFSKLL